MLNQNGLSWAGLADDPVLHRTVDGLMEDGRRWSMMELLSKARSQGQEDGPTGLENESVD